MRKARILISLLLTALSGCALYTSQDIDKAALLSTGMSQEEVRAIMGLPISSEISGNNAEWHYCKTGLSDRFVALRFLNGRLFETELYSVTIADAVNAGMSNSDCRYYVKMGTYSKAQRVVRAPTSVPSPQTGNPPQPTVADVLEAFSEAYNSAQPAKLIEPTPSRSNTVNCKNLNDLSFPPQIYTFQNTCPSGYMRVN